MTRPKNSTHTISQPDIDHTVPAAIANAYDVSISWLRRGEVVEFLENRGRCDVPLSLELALDNGRH